jgi:thiol peroxidase
MAQITLGGNPIHTAGELPAVGSTAPGFTLVRADLSEATLEDYAGKKKVLNIFPSLDTDICATAVRTFNQKAGGREGTIVLNVSADLPFAHRRFCATEGLEGVETLSVFRSSFGDDYGLKMVDGKMAGLCSRSVIVLDEANKVLYTEQVPEIAKEPDYDAALAAL